MVILPLISNLISDKLLHSGRIQAASQPQQPPILSDLESLAHQDDDTHADGRLLQRECVLSFPLEGVTSLGAR